MINRETMSCCKYIDTRVMLAERIKPMRGQISGNIFSIFVKICVLFKKGFTLKFYHEVLSFKPKVLFIVSHSYMSDVFYRVRKTVHKQSGGFRRWHSGRQQRGDIAVHVPPSCTSPPQHVRCEKATTPPTTPGPTWIPPKSAHPHAWTMSWTQCKT